MATLGVVLANHTKVAWDELKSYVGSRRGFARWGPGQERFGGLKANIAYFDALTSLKGINFQNPKQMDFATAAKFHAKVVAARLASPELYELYASHDDYGCRHNSDTQSQVIATR